MHLQAYVIEDNATIRENLVGTLEELTCVKVAGSSATEDEAMAWLEQNIDRWDLVIVDLFLKQGSGIHLAQRIRRMRPNQKIVVFSNYINAERAQALRATRRRRRLRQVDRNRLPGGLLRSSVLPHFAGPGRVGAPERLGVDSPRTSGGRREDGSVCKCTLTLITGAAGRIRTHDPLVRSQVLYPTELQPLSRRL